MVLSSAQVLGTGSSRLINSHTGVIKVDQSTDFVLESGCPVFENHGIFEVNDDFYSSFNIDNHNQLNFISGDIYLEPTCPTLLDGYTTSSSDADLNLGGHLTLKTSHVLSSANPVNIIGNVTLNPNTVIDVPCFNVLPNGVLNILDRSDSITICSNEGQVLMSNFDGTLVVHGNDDSTKFYFSDSNVYLSEVHLTESLLETSSDSIVQINSDSVVNLFQNTTLEFKGIWNLSKADVFVSDSDLLLSGPSFCPECMHFNNLHLTDDGFVQGISNIDSFDFLHGTVGPSSNLSVVFFNASSSGHKVFDTDVFVTIKEGVFEGSGDFEGRTGAVLYVPQGSEYLVTADADMTLPFYPYVPTPRPLLLSHGNVTFAPASQTIIHWDFITHSTAYQKGPGSTIIAGEASSCYDQLEIVHGELVFSGTFNVTETCTISGTDSLRIDVLANSSVPAPVVIVDGQIDLAPPLNMIDGLLDLREATITVLQLNWEGGIVLFANLGGDTLIFDVIINKTINIDQNNVLKRVIVGEMHSHNVSIGPATIDNVTISHNFGGEFNFTDGAVVGNLTFKDLKGGEIHLETGSDVHIANGTVNGGDLISHTGSNPNHGSITVNDGNAIFHCQNDQQTFDSVTVTNGNFILDSSCDTDNPLIDNLNVLPESGTFTSTPLPVIVDELQFEGSNIGPNTTLFLTGPSTISLVSTPTLKEGSSIVIQPSANLTIEGGDGSLVLEEDSHITAEPDSSLIFDSSKKPILVTGDGDIVVKEDADVLFTGENPITVKVPIKIDGNASIENGAKVILDEPSIINGDIYVCETCVLEVNDKLELTGRIYGPGDVIINDGGSIEFSGTSDLTGEFQVEGGDLVFIPSDSSSFDNSNIDLSSGNVLVQTGANVHFNNISVSASGGNMTIEQGSTVGCPHFDHILLDESAWMFIDRPDCITLIDLLDLEDTASFKSSGVVHLDDFNFKGGSVLESTEIHVLDQLNAYSPQPKNFNDHSIVFVNASGSISLEGSSEAVFNFGNDSYILVDVVGDLSIGTNAGTIKFDSDCSDCDNGLVNQGKTSVIADSPVTFNTPVKTVNDLTLSSSDHSNVITFASGWIADGHVSMEDNVKAVVDAPAIINGDIYVCETCVLEVNDKLELTGRIYGPGDVVINDGGSIEFSGTSNLTGDFQVEGGDLVFVPSDSASFDNSNIDLSSGNVLVQTGANVHFNNISVSASGGNMTIEQGSTVGCPHFDHILLDESAWMFIDRPDCITLIDLLDLEDTASFKSSGVVHLDDFNFKGGSVLESTEIHVLDQLNAYSPQPKNFNDHSIVFVNASGSISLEGSSEAVFNFGNDSYILVDVVGDLSIGTNAGTIKFDSDCSDCDNGLVNQGKTSVIADSPVTFNTPVKTVNDLTLSSSDHSNVITFASGWIADGHVSMEDNVVVSVIGSVVQPVGASMNIMDSATGHLVIKTSNASIAGDLSCEQTSSRCISVDEGVLTFESSMTSSFANIRLVDDGSLLHSGHIDDLILNVNTGLVAFEAGSVVELLNDVMVAPDSSVVHNHGSTVNEVGKLTVNGDYFVKSGALLTMNQTSINVVNDVANFTSFTGANWSLTDVKLLINEGLFKVQVDSMDDVDFDRMEIVGGTVNFELEEQIPIETLVVNGPFAKKTGSSDFNVYTEFVFTEGNLDGTAATNVYGKLLIDSDKDQVLSNAHVLNTFSTAEFGLCSIVARDDVTFNIHHNSAVSITNRCNIIQNSHGAVLIVFGSLETSAPVFVNWTIANTGLFTVHDDVFVVDYPSSSDGISIVDGTLKLSNSFSFLSNSTILNSTGKILVSNPKSNVSIDGTVEMPGKLDLRDGVVSFLSESITNVINIHQSNGTLLMDGTFRDSSLIVNGGQSHFLGTVESFNYLNSTGSSSVFLSPHSVIDFTSTFILVEDEASILISKDSDLTMKDTVAHVYGGHVLFEQTSDDRLLAMEKLVVCGGIFEVNDQYSLFVDTFSLCGGVRSGTGNIDVLKYFSWTAGNLTDPGTTTLYAESLFTEDSPKNLINGHSLINHGEMTIQDTQIDLFDGSQLINVDGDVIFDGESFLISDDDDFSFHNEENASVIVTNESSATISLNFVNHGHVSSQNNTSLDIGGNPSVSHGTFSIPKSSTLLVHGKFEFAPNSTIVGAGSLVVYSPDAHFKLSSTIDSFTNFSIVDQAQFSLDNDQCFLKNVFLSVVNASTIMENCKVFNLDLLIDDDALVVINGTTSVTGLDLVVSHGNLDVNTTKYLTGVDNSWDIGPGYNANVYITNSVVNGTFSVSVFNNSSLNLVDNDVIFKGLLLDNSFFFVNSSTPTVIQNFESFSGTRDGRGELVVTNSTVVDSVSLLPGGKSLFNGDYCLFTGTIKTIDHDLFLNCIGSVTESEFLLSESIVTFMDESSLSVTNVNFTFLIDYDSSSAVFNGTSLHSDLTVFDVPLQVFNEMSVQSSCTLILNNNSTLHLSSSVQVDGDLIVSETSNTFIHGDIAFDEGLIINYGDTIFSDANASQMNLLVHSGQVTLLESSSFEGSTTISMTNGLVDILSDITDVSFSGFSGPAVASISSDLSEVRIFNITDGVIKFNNGSSVSKLLKFSIEGDSLIIFDSGSSYVPELEHTLFGIKRW
ncbi:hypothetical protein GEMRC1_008243 [Eukaryota sp. GEM-RC1]